MSAVAFEKLHTSSPFQGFVARDCGLAIQTSLCKQVRGQNNTEDADKPVLFCLLICTFLFYIVVSCEIFAMTPKV